MTVPGSIPSRLIQKYEIILIEVRPIRILIRKKGITGINLNVNKYIFPFSFIPAFIFINFSLNLFCKKSLNRNLDTKNAIVAPIVLDSETIINPFQNPNKPPAAKDKMLAPGKEIATEII